MTRKRNDHAVRLTDAQIRELLKAAEQQKKELANPRILDSAIARLEAVRYAAVRTSQP